MINNNNEKIVNNNESNEREKMTEKMTEEIKNLIAKLEQYDESTNEDEIEELTYIADVVLDLGGIYTPAIKEYFDDSTQANIAQLNLLVSIVNPDRMKVVYSSAILRYTYSQKEYLTAWEDLRCQIYQHCINKSIDVNDCLYGLMEGMVND